MNQVIRLMKRIALSPLFWIITICSSIFFLENSDLSNYFLISDFATNFPSLSLSGQYYRLLTSLFLHTGITHLVSNMFLLIILTWVVSPIISKALYLSLLLLSGVLGNLLADVLIVSLVNSDGNYWSFLTTFGYSHGIVGLSTSITGLYIFALIIFVFKASKNLPQKKFRLSALIFVSFIGILSLILNFIWGQWFTITAYVHFFGGLVGGMLAFIFLYRQHKKLGLKTHDINPLK